MSEYRTKFVEEDDKAGWWTLFCGYADFYGVAVNDTSVNNVWAWLLDSGHALEGLLTRDVEGTAIGFAHVRACPRTLGGCDIGFLDDLYVCPEGRGSGAADALFNSLGDLAAERGWPEIRWVTQHFNERGRSFYDRYTSGPSDFIMYRWAL